jgi:hypothetical protein
MYQPDPAASVRRLSRMVRPGGVVTFLEMSMPMTRSVPDAPLFNRCTGWILETIRRAGFEMDMGSKLARAFVDGGLATSTMMVRGVAASGRESQVYAYIADSLRSLLPLGEQHGVFTAEEAQVDTLAESGGRGSCAESLHHAAAPRRRVDSRTRCRVVADTEMCPRQAQTLER